VTAQLKGLSHLRHVMAAHQLGANAGQFAFPPLRVKQKHGLSDDQARTARSEGTEVHHVPGPDDAIDGAVLTHRADPDAILQS